MRPQAQAMLADSGQGWQGPAWQGLGHRWLPQRSFLPHGCTRKHWRISALMLARDIKGQTCEAAFELQCCS